MEKKRSKKTMIILAIPIVLIGLWRLPFTRALYLRLFFVPVSISLPTLQAPNAITPANAKNVRILEHWGNGTFKRINWSPDGKYFAIGTTFGVNLYDAGTFELLRSIYISADPTEQLAFSPDGSQFALADSTGIITLFDIRANKILRRWTIEEYSSISFLTFLKDGALVYVTNMSGAGTYKIMRLVNDGQQVIKTFNDGSLSRILFIPERQSFLAIYADSTELISPYDGQSQKLSSVVPYLTDEFFFDTTRIEMDGERGLISAYVNDKLVKQKTVKPGYDRSVAISPKGGLMATLHGMYPDSYWYSGNSGKVLTFWHIPTLEQVRTFLIPEATSYDRYEIVFSPDGEKIAILAGDLSVKIFPTNESSPFEITLTDQFASVRDVSVSSDGKILTVNCAGTGMNILELPSGGSVAQWHFDKPICGKLLGNGSFVAISRDYEISEVKIYKVRDEGVPVTEIGEFCCDAFSANGDVGARSTSFVNSDDYYISVSIWQQFGLMGVWPYSRDEAGSQRNFGIAVSASGQYVAASGRRTTHLYVRGIESGREYPALGASIAFSPDEKLLASGYRILDLETGNIIKLEVSSNLECSDYEHKTPAFSPDGQIMAAITCDYLLFWRVSDGTLLAKLDNPYKISQVKFSPDGTFLVGRGEGVINKWALPALTP